MCDEQADRMTIVPVRAEIEDLVDISADIEKIASGFLFTEGPVWSAADQRLLFSDIPGDCIYGWSEGEGAAVFRRPSGQANGNTIDWEGRLLTCEHANRRISRTGPDGAPFALVDSYQGKRLNSPNDLVCAANGDVYFTDPPYGLRRADGTFAAQELPFQGIFRWSARTGDLALLAYDFVRPNGIALSSDESRLYVADTQLAHIRVFDVNVDGRAENGRVFVETEHEGVKARPDGIKIDERGNLYVASSTPQGVWVYDPDGRLLGQIGIAENPANLGFGGPTWRTLFITAQTSVYRVELKVAGQPVGPPQGRD